MRLLSLIYLVKASTPALAEALGETKPEPDRVYVAVMERKTPPVKKQKQKLIMQKLIWVEFL